MNDYKIKELMEKMELELISSMKKNLSKHLKEEDKIGFEFPQWQARKLKELKRYQRENKDIIDGYSRGLDKKVSQHLKEELNQGAINSIKRHNKLFNTNIKASKLLNKSFFKTNDRKVNTLINVVNNDLKVASTSALRMINDEYRQVIHKSAFFLANGTVSPKQAIDMATKEFLSRGLNCIEYKDGRRVNIASYSEMAVRTASLRTQLMGDGDFRKSIGRHLVIALASNAACPKCAKWENKVMIDDVYSGGTKKDGDYPLLSYAMKNGFLHPNCRDGIATYYPELEDIDKSYEDGKDGSERELAYQDDLNYINQRIKQFTRLQIGSLDEDNIKKYHNQRIAYEKKRDRLTAKEELSYKDVTQEWSGNRTGDGITKNAKSIILNNKEYFVNDKNKIIHKNNEVAISELTVKTFGGELQYLPDITEDDNIRCGDCFYKNEIWDIKELGQNATSKTRAIDNLIKSSKGQSNNFIISITSSKLDRENILVQIQKIYSTKNRDWIDKIIVFDNNKLLKVIVRKK